MACAAALAARCGIIVPSHRCPAAPMQLLRGASNVPLWPDWDEAPADREPVAADESFALLPWWLSGSLGNRGMEGFWSLAAPAQVCCSCARALLGAAWWEALTVRARNVLRSLRTWCTPGRPKLCGRG